jgi:hypothetical protein
MSYYFFDVDGYVSDGPSSHGLLILHEELDGPAAKELLVDGWTERLDDLDKELVRALKDTDETAEIALLQKTVRRASEILILSDGLE